MVANHIHVQLERGESTVMVKLKIWDNRLTFTIHTEKDKITVAWTESGQWQSKDMSYGDVEQWITDELG